ncbi:MAG: type II secretion system GspH family protein [Gammaproteobacteria bacterium]|nr:type II secretion system GspH family protein [Gammaproteobacteria bacterium]
MIYRRREQGVTLVELVVAITVIGIAASVILGLLSSNVGASADPMVRQQAVAVARAYMEEILLNDFDDPDGIDGEVARVDFDDVDDYDALVDVGARNQFDNAIAGLADYTVAVDVNGSGALPGVPVADALRVDVTVSRAPLLSFTLSGYRTR